MTVKFSQASFCKNGSETKQNQKKSTSTMTEDNNDKNVATVYSLAFKQIKKK